MQGDQGTDLDTFITRCNPKHGDLFVTAHAVWMYVAPRTAWQFPSLRNKTTTIHLIHECWAGLPSEGWEYKEPIGRDSSKA